ncbi:MAG: FtsX-like permease family protein [Acholeplasmatales bacterium]|nr:FtsX-like permease family protein [Acholeplasmatales bacterium]
MKLRDNLYLSMLLIKKNKRVIRIIIMMVIAFTLLSVSIFLSTSFMIGISNDINKNKASFIVEVEYGDSLYNHKDGYEYNELLDDLYYKENSLKYNNNLNCSYHDIKMINRIENKNDQTYQKDVYSPIYTIDGVRYDFGVNASGILDDAIVDMLFFDMNNTSTIIDSVEEKYMKDNNCDFSILGNGFSDNSKELMISSAVLDSLGIDDYNSVIGKCISLENYLSNAIYFFYKNDVKNEEIYDFNPIYYGNKYSVFEEYKIVGVFNEKVSSLPVEMTNAQLWFKEEDYFNTEEYVDFKSFNSLPLYSTVYKDDLYDIMQLSLDEDKVFIAPGYSTLLNRINPNIIQRYSFKSLDKAYEFYKYICTELKEEQLVYLDPITINSILDGYIKYYPMLKVIITILLFAGLAMLGATFIDFYYILYEDIKDNKRFFGLMFSNGLKTKDLYKIYVIYSFLISGISLLISCVISGLTSYILMRKANNIFVTKINYENAINYSIDFKYFFSSQAIILAISLILIVLVAFIITIAFKKKNLSLLLKNSE